jgi:hypothetical protein
MNNQDASTEPHWQCRIVVTEEENQKEEEKEMSVGKTLRSLNIVPWLE